MIGNRLTKNILKLQNDKKEIHFIMNLHFLTKKPA